MPVNSSIRNLLMIRLRTLGGFGLELDGADSTSSSVRPRVLALLALLAGHRQGLSRDKVLVYLWPESDTAHARNSLKQALFSLRHVVARPIVISASGLLRLEPSEVDVDLWELEAALANGQESLAVGLYRGPFLDGFYVSGLGEFEHWVEAERERLAHAHADAVRTLAARAERAGDRTSSIAWWRQLASIEPLSPTTALGLMRALEEAGDPAGALEYARQHTAAVRAEFGEMVSEEVRALMRRLMVQVEERLADVSARAVALTLPSPPARRPRSRAGWPVSLTATGLRPMPTAAMAWALLIAVSLAFVLSGSPPTRGSRPSATASAEASTLTVLPFTITGTPEIRELGAGLEDLLSARLDGAEGLRSVPPPPAGLAPLAKAALPLDRRSGAALARRVGARLYLVGRLSGADGRLRASATIYDRGNADVLVTRAEAEVQGSALFDLADALASQLLQDLYQGSNERLARVAVSTTRSLPALKAFMEGERQFRSDSFARAVDAFQRAVRADTAFALAYYRLSVAADWSGHQAVALWGAELAARFSQSLSEHDRALVEAYLVQRRGRIAEAERRYRAIVAEFPEDGEAWFQLAEVLFHSNPLRGRTATSARPALERALELDPGNQEVLFQLARVAALEGRRGQADSLVGLMRAAPGSPAVDLRAFRALSLGGTPGDYLVTRDLLSDPRVVPLDTVLRLALQPDDLPGTERLAGLLARNARSCEEQGLGRRLLAQAELARGRLALARARLASETECDSAAALELRTIYETLPFGPWDRSGLLQLMELLRDDWSDSVATAGDRATRLYERGRVASALGDTALAGRLASMLAALNDSSGEGTRVRSLTQSLRARLALAQGQVARALALLEVAHWERVTAPSVAEADDRYLRAELLLRLGRAREASGWYGSMAQRFSYELVYLAPARFRLGQIADRAGDRAAALGYYRRFLELWREAEPGAPFVAEAAARVGELQRSTEE
jgi:DNA-binding SARP family transcriptional activator/tetratricopeptide (TPR) repeat protein